MVNPFSDRASCQEKRSFRAEWARGDVGRYVVPPVWGRLDVAPTTDDMTDIFMQSSYHAVVAAFTNNTA